MRVRQVEAVDPRPVDDHGEDPAAWERDAPEGAEWRRDPAGRFDDRWWDGEGWTRHVRHGRAVATEITPAPLVARGHRGGGEAPGWRADPDGPGQRYWDGHGWTAKRRSGPPRERGRAPIRAWWSRTALAAAAVVLALLLAVVAVVIVVIT